MMGTYTQIDLGRCELDPELHVKTDGCRDWHWVKTLTGQPAYEFLYPLPEPQPHHNID